MKWLVLLEGKEHHLRSLSQLLRSPDFRVIKEEGSYYLTSSRLDSVTDDVQMFNYATELLNLINGAAWLYWLDFKPFTLDVIVRIDEDGTRHREILLSAIWDIEDLAFNIEFDDTDEVYQSPTNLESWIMLQEKDEKVEKVCRILFSRDKDWVNLYKVYEVVQKDVGDRITKDGWATGKKVNKFAQTAQSPAAIGDDARHGVDRHEPPKDPMSLLEAQSLIIGIVRKWLDWKCQEKK